MIRYFLLSILCFSVLAVSAQTEETPNSVVAPNLIKSPKNQAAGKARTASPAQNASPKAIPARQTTQSQQSNIPARKNAGTNAEEETASSEEKEKRRFLKFMARAADQIVMNAVGVTAAIVLVVPTIYAASTIISANSDP